MFSYLYVSIYVILQQYRSAIAMNTKKKPLPIYLDTEVREKIEVLAKQWGVSLSSAVNRVIREFNDGQKN